MTPKTERSGSRFVVTNTDDGSPLIRLELFHDTVAGLKSITVGFEVLSGTTLGYHFHLDDSGRLAG